MCSFPYSIVEIKLQTEQPPAWLQSIITSGLSHENGQLELCNGAALRLCEQLQASAWLR